MAAKIEVREGTLTLAVAFSDPAAWPFPGVVFDVGIQCSLKSKNPSRPVLSRTGSPTCWVRKSAKRDIGTALPVMSLPILLIPPFGGGEAFCPLDGISPNGVWTRDFRWSAMGDATLA